MIIVLIIIILLLLVGAGLGDGHSGITIMGEPKGKRPHDPPSPQGPKIDKSLISYIEKGYWPGGIKK